MAPDLVAIVLKHYPKLKTYRERNGKMLVKLTRALYGIVIASMKWYKLVSAFLKQIGFIENPVEACVFNRKMRDGSTMTLVLYVDDILVKNKYRRNVDWLVKLLKREFEDVTVDDSLSFSYLGMHLTQKPNEKIIELSMSHYVEKAIAEYEEALGRKLKTYKNPVNGNLFNDSSTELSRYKKLFHRMVAKLLFLCKRV